MEIDDLDFFLLNLVDTCPYELAILAREEPWGPWPEPRPTRADIVEHLLYLERAGDLAVSLSEKGRSKAIRPTADELDAGICGALLLSYKLTPQGGHRWAHAKGIDWDEWVQVDYGSSITTRTRERTAFWLEVFRRWDGDIIGDICWKRLFPWRPFYWNEQRIGHRASFDSRLDFHRYRDLPTRPDFHRKRKRASLSPRRATVPPAADRPLEYLPNSQVHAMFRSNNPRDVLAAGLELGRRDVNLRGELTIGYPVNRYVAARVAGERKDFDSVGALLRTVVTSSDIAAIEALAAIGDPACLEPFQFLLQYHLDDAVVDTLRRTIATFQPPTPPPVVEAGTPRPEPKRDPTANPNADHWKERLRAVCYLQTPTSPESQAALTRLCDDPDIVVRGCARWGL